jgi:hypothetical protein
VFAPLVDIQSHKHGVPGFFAHVQAPYCVRYAASRRAVSPAPSTVHLQHGADDYGRDSLSASKSVFIEAPGKADGINNALYAPELHTHRTKSPGLQQDVVHLEKLDMADLVWPLSLYRGDVRVLVKEQNTRI